MNSHFHKKTKNIYLMTHAEDVNQLTNDKILDPPLSDLGLVQSNGLNFNFGLVICSPMRSAKETLQYSNISYTDLIINDNCRPVRCSYSDFLLLEPLFKEQKHEFKSRMQNLADYLIKSDYSNILVLCHSCVVIAFTGKSLDNAEMIKLECKDLYNVSFGNINYSPSCGDDEARHNTWH